MVHACCLAHARRKYVDAVKVNANDQESACIVALMDQLFAIDREAREQNMDHAERNLLRQERVPKLLEQLRGAALAMKKTALPKSAAGQAANYTLSFWSKLTVFLKHPELELSTNLAENSMRPIAIGRKNWLHLGSKEAGPVGSRTGAVLRRFGLSVAPRFLWECLIIRTVSLFPVPASSNAACRFPALRFPVCFAPWVMRPIKQEALSA